MENLPTSTEAPNIVTPPSGGRLNKFALFGLIFIVLVVVVEGVYFLLRPVKKDTSPVNNDLVGERKIQTTPPATTFKKLDLARVESNYNYFKTLNENGTQDFLSGANLETIVTGTVWQGVQEETISDGITYSYTLLFFDDDQREFRVNFTSEEISTMKFENLTNLSDIKQGDVVTVNRKTNFLNNSLPDEILITRVSSTSD